MQGVEGGSFAQVIGYSPQAKRVWRFSFADPSHADAFFALHVDGHGKTFRKEFYAGCFREYSDSFPDIGVFFETRENCDTVTVSDRYSYGVGVYWDIAVKNFLSSRRILFSSRELPEASISPINGIRLEHIGKGRVSGLSIG